MALNSVYPAVLSNILFGPEKPGPVGHVKNNAYAILIG
jgi:hypothetical protein